MSWSIFFNIWYFVSTRFLVLATVSWYLEYYTSTATTILDTVPHAIFGYGKLFFRNPRDSNSFVIFLLYSLLINDRFKTVFDMEIILYFFAWWTSWLVVNHLSRKIIFRYILIKVFCKLWGWPKIVFALIRKPLWGRGSRIYEHWTGGPGRSRWGWEHFWRVLVGVKKFDVF